MKIVILYRPNSEHARVTEDFIRDYRQRHSADKLEIINVDGREGGAMASLYDVTSYPAILAMRDDGSALNTWQGTELPLLDEVASYAYA